MGKIVIIGGNESMEQEYKQVCLKHHYHAKIITKKNGKMTDAIGQPNYIVLFTGTVAHKMMYAARKEARKAQIPILYVHSSSSTALEKALSHA